MDKQQPTINGSWQRRKMMERAADNESGQRAGGVDRRQKHSYNNQPSAGDESVDAHNDDRQRGDDGQHRVGARGWMQGRGGVHDVRENYFLCML